MAVAALSIKLRCASWQQLATIYKRDLSRGSMFLKASTPPALGTAVSRCHSGAFQLLYNFGLRALCPT